MQPMSEASLQVLLSRSARVPFAKTYVRGGESRSCLMKVELPDE